MFRCCFKSESAKKKEAEKLKKKYLLNLFKGEARELAKTGYEKIQAVKCCRCGYLKHQLTHGVECGRFMCSECFVSPGRGCEDLHRLMPEDSMEAVFSLQKMIDALATVQDLY